MIWMAVIFVLLCPLAMGWGLWLIFALLAAIPGQRRGIVTPGKPGAISDGAGKMDVLIPAHDEELVLPALLESLQRQTVAGKLRLGRVLVVADHCADATAAIARRFAAEVFERNSGPRGKPAALRDGLAMLNGADGAGTGKAFVLPLDADCTVSENFLEAMGAAMDAGCKVAQAAYVLERGGGPQHSPGTIAFALKNLVRPRGMAKLGIPTQLFGTGMCFRAELLQDGTSGVIRFSDHLTEDLAVSHDLLLKGIGPTFVVDALVRSAMPEDRGAMATQKLRWETGQVHTWLKLPGMMSRLALRGDWRGMLALADWSMPPVAMGLVAWATVCAATVILIALKLVAWPMIFAPVCVFALLAGYIVIGTLQIAGFRGLGRLIFAAPRFFLWKLGLYGRMLTGRGARGWEKTARTLPPEVRP